MKESYNESSKSKKKVIPKNLIKYSRNKESIDFKGETKENITNTVQSNVKTSKPVNRFYLLSKTLI